MDDEAGAAWLRHMRRGDWSAAWALSDTVLRACRSAPGGQRPRHEQAVWDGTPLAGRRVLVRCYHGLGDTLQFIRFVPEIAGVAAEVTVWAQPALLPLLGTMPGVGRLLPLHDGAPEGEYDVDLEVMELPHALRTTLATLPARVPYLHPPAPDQPRHATGTLAVGLVWRAGEWNPRRSVPPVLLQQLAAVPGVDWHVLQRGAGLAERPPGFGIDRGTDDVLALATRMRGLDLMVSVDSMPAHLAGALGIPVWLLLAYDADWRWMEGRADNPWYPTMRLFRQIRDGAWEDVVTRVATSLADRAAPDPARLQPPAAEHEP